MNRPWLSMLMFTVVVLALLPSSSSGVDLMIVGEEDTVRQSLTNAALDMGSAHVGTGGTVNVLAGQAGILFFELPDLATTPTILQASLSLTLMNARDLGSTGQVPGRFGVDLYSLGTRTLGEIIKPGDYGDGSNGRPAEAVLVVGTWWTPGNDSQIGSTKTVDITETVRGVYLDGTPDDVFLVLAVYADEGLNAIDFTTYYLNDSLLSIEAVNEGPDLVPLVE